MNSDESDWSEQDRKANTSRAEWRKEQSAELRDRLIFLLDDLAPSRGKYAYLQHRTGISKSTWQNLYLEKQMPTLDMILAIAEYRHPYLSWLITGQDPREKTAQLMYAAPTAQIWEKFQEHREWLRMTKQRGENKDDDQTS